MKEEYGRYRSLGGDMSQRYKSLRVGGTARQGPGMGQEPGRVHVSGRVRRKSLGCKRPRGDSSMEVQEYDTWRG